jgi:hypothetical protein
MKIGCEDALSSCFAKDGDRDVYYPWGGGLASYYVSPKEKNK